MTIKRQWTADEEMNAVVEAVAALVPDDLDDQLDLAASLLDYVEQNGIPANLEEIGRTELERIRALRLPKLFPPSDPSDPHE